MDGSTFDRIARLLARGASRRALVAVVAALATARSHRALGKQLTPSTCGASGEVCTMLVGCCDGLTCVTSAINTNYGVCVPGEGGTVSIGTTLISPFSEGVEQEIAALASGAETTDATTSTTTTTTTEETEQESRIAEQKARKETRRTAKNTRQATQKTEQQTRRETRRDARKLRRGPDVEVSVTCPQGSGESQVVTINNRASVDVVIAQLTSMLTNSDGDEPFLDLPDILAGTMLDIFFGTAPDGKEVHSIERIFDDSPFEGVRVTLGSGHVRRACCDDSTTCLDEDAKNARKRRSRRKRNAGKAGHRDKNRKRKSG